MENSPAPIFFKPQRANTLIALYKKQPLEDLTSIDLAPDPNAPTGDPVLDYGAGGLDAAPGDGYVFRTDGPNGTTLFGAIRPTHVGTTFVIIDWAFQTDRDNPELRRGANRSRPDPPQPARHPARLVRSSSPVEIRAHAGTSPARRGVAHHR